MKRALLILTLFTLVQAIFKTFRNDGFAENLLSNLTTFDVHAVGHSILTLKDGSVVITGIIRYPTDMQNHTFFEDERDIPEAEEAASAGMIVRVYNNGTNAWAKRMVLCTKDATFTSVFDGDHIYVAGGTTGVVQGIGTAQCCTNVSGMVLLKYNINGTREAISVHGDEKERYTAISLTSTEGDTLFLVSCTPRGTGPYRDMDQASWPVENGLTISRVRKRDMVPVQQQVISLADDASITGELIKDEFWDMVVSNDGSSIYVTANREVLRFSYSRFPTVFAINGNNLTVQTTRSLENELQIDTRLATSPLTGGVFASYVDRRANKENLVVRHMDRNLTDIPVTGDEEIFRYRIILERDYLKEVLSTVKDVHIDEDGTTRVLVYSAEIVNRTLQPAGASPPPSFDVHRKLTNGRPAVVVISSSQQVRQITQAQSSQQWEPFRMVVGGAEHVMTGADRGTVFNGKSKVLLTGIEREILVTPSPSASSTPAAASPSPSEAPRGSGADCVGESTRLFGRGIREMVQTDDRFRIQLHPMKWGRVEVLCHKWKNGTEDLLCATRDHIVRHWGRLMYMSEFCEVVGCETVVDAVMNFKGQCGDEVIAHEALSITMHAGGDNIVETVKKECWLMRRRKLWWLVTSL